MAVFLQLRKAIWNLKLSKWKSSIKLIFLFKIICFSPHSNDLSMHLFFSVYMGQDAFSCFHKRNFSDDTKFSAHNTYLFQEVCRKKERIIAHNKQLHHISFDKWLLRVQGVTNSVINYVWIYECYIHQYTMKIAQSVSFKSCC